MKNKKENTKLSKEDFINNLSRMSRDEINNYIKEKGKPRKLIIPVLFNK